MSKLNLHTNSNITYVVDTLSLILRTGVQFLSDQRKTAFGFSSELSVDAKP
jgi:hypothetical protein